ncbi:hypothetical protein BDV93DRAFT_524639 [Ceratobasidium sp. AG-I]|nr:hypothetical protein BDV93DRAFT_524639 [Ceratobasidium sp. AG-I]
MLYSTLCSICCVLLEQSAYAALLKIIILPRDYVDLSMLLGLAFKPQRRRQKVVCLPGASPLSPFHSLVTHPLSPCVAPCDRLDTITEILSPSYHPVIASAACNANSYA